MSDDKVKEQIDRHERVPEARALKAPDVQGARLSGHAEMNRVEQARTNASDGSLRKLPADWQEQNESIQLTDGDVSISRTNPLREADLAKGIRRNANGKPYAVYSAEASQAVESPGPIAKVLTDGEYQSSVKLNVQITNVPEVSAGLDPQDGIKYVSTVMDAGVAAVRQVEHHMTEPGAVNKDIQNTANHFKQSPFQFQKDVLGAFFGAVDKLDKPMAAEQRASAAGVFMPMFFFEGGGPTPIDKAAVNQMKLDQMTAEELKMLGIERKEMFMPEVPQEVSQLELQEASPELLNNMKAKGRTFVVATEGSEELAYMEKMKVNALVRGEDSREIWLKERPHKIAALEEFLHGTQAKHGWLEAMPEEIAEVKVKDFMLRHQKLLGLTENDCSVLQVMKQREIEYAMRRGFTQYEIEVKRWLGLPLR
jgi:hypothetical protein